MDDKGSWHNNILHEIQQANIEIRNTKNLKTLIWQIGALIRYHYRIDPTTLSHGEIIQLYAELLWVREQEAKASQL